MATVSIQLLHQRLQAAAEGRRQLKKQEQTYQKLWAALAEEEAKAESEEKQVLKEYRDVERLEDGGIAALFYSILGNKEQQTEKERQEFLRARLSFESCISRLASIRKDLTETQKKLDELSRFEQEYLSAFKEKEAAIIGLNDDRTKQLEHNFEETMKVEEESKQIVEAIDAGNKVIRELDTMIEALMAARDWGNWDLIGGGILVSATKHSKIDKAKRALHRVQHRLYFFNQELADLADREVVIRFDGFTRFADSFFDGLIVDWIVQRGINKSLSNTRDLYRAVHQTIHDLKARHQACENKFYLLQEEREDLIHSL
jgi:hypothetical protein